MRYTQTMIEQPSILYNRSCGSCTLCCKLLAIEELEKPQNQLCAHCDEGKGCKIYDSRPRECAAFLCGYLNWPMAETHWFPASCNMVIVSKPEGQLIAIHVVPARPMAWREEPFYSDIKNWAVHAAPDMIQVVVFIENRAIVILPDEDVYLGPIGPDDRIILGEIVEVGTNRLWAIKVKVDDPTIAGMELGRFCLGSPFIERFQNQGRQRAEDV